MIAILITFAVVAQSAIGGLHGTLVLCVGGQDAESVTTTETQCGHDHGTPIQPPTHDHNDDCCEDVQLTLTELLTLPRLDDTSIDLPAIAPCDAWIVVAIDTGLSWRGPPQPPGRDPSRDQCLAIVASTRLTL